MLTGGSIKNSAPFCQRKQYKGAECVVHFRLLEGQIREHLLDPSQERDTQQVAATEELIDVLRSYLK